VIGELTFPLEAVVEDLGQPPARGERHQAVPHVARRRHPELLSEPAARASVVCHRDYRGEVPDAIPEVPKEHRQPRAAAERHHPQICTYYPWTVSILPALSGQVLAVVGLGPIPVWTRFGRKVVRAVYLSVSSSLSPKIGNSRALATEVSVKAKTPDRTFASPLANHGP
jgi:hypothetical protein